jgi:DNA-binding transcriptional LysR family regulator
MSQPTKTKLEAVSDVSGHNTPQEELGNFRVSLKHWRMLHAVVTCGSFANAAEFLHVSQPAISYTIAKLEEILGVPLLKLEGRKAHITEPGRVLLERSRYLLREAIELEKFAEGLRRGWGPEIKLAVDQSFPTRVLIPALRTFSQHGRSAKIHLFEVSGPKIEKVLHEHAADLVINGQVPSGYHGELLIEIEYVPVAHPDHPLFKLEREVTTDDLDCEVRIIADSEIAVHPREKANGATVVQRWHVSNFDTAENVLTECLGFGWLPIHRIEKSLTSGQLKILPLRDNTTYKSYFYLIHGRPAFPSSDVNRLAEALHVVAATAALPMNGERFDVNKRQLI